MLPGIEHIIMLMMENHSWDNLFGALGRGDGLTFNHDGQAVQTNPYANGTQQRAFRMPNTCQLHSQPSQEWQASHNAFDDGRLDGFVRTPIAPGIGLTVGPVAMGYFTDEELPFTLDLARHFPVGDRFFCSALAQTFPNRMFLIAGTPSGITDNNLPIAQLVLSAGTIFNTLDSFNISWRNYIAGDFPTGATPELYAINDNVTEARNHRTIQDFFSDAAAGTLPSFSLLEPNYTFSSQENPQNMANGDAFLSDIVTAIGDSPLWSKILFILNYDEHGGYFDHVVPPVALAPDSITPVLNPNDTPFDGFWRYGFRVPSVVVSPFAKQGKKHNEAYVSHIVYDHTSVLATLQYKWNLPALTWRDANANHLLDFVDLEALSKGRMTVPSMPKLARPGNTTEALSCTGPGVLPPPGTVFSQ
jgi:phospholipase C